MEDGNTLFAINLEAKNYTAEAQQTSHNALLSLLRAVRLEVHERLQDATADLLETALEILPTYRQMYGASGEDLPGTLKVIAQEQKTAPLFKGPTILSSMKQGMPRIVCSDLALEAHFEKKEQKKPLFYPFLSSTGKTVEEAAKRMLINMKNPRTFLNPKDVGPWNISSCSIIVKNPFRSNSPQSTSANAWPRHVFVLC